MKTVRASLGAGLMLVLSCAASAQSGDTKYCNDLSAAYQRYAQDSKEHRGYRPPPADISVALTRCQSDPLSAIPVLKKALHDAKVELPKRS